MCVTNTTSRRPVTLASQVSASPSMISQRLCDSLFSLSSAVQSSTTPTVVTHVEEKVAPVPSAVLSDAEKNRMRRTRRKRKAQKPGKTAKLNDRHFVVHNYHDHSKDQNYHLEAADDNTPRRRGGVSVAFPLKLHAMLDQIEADGLSHVISWQPHGRCFVIHKPHEFVEEVMPKYFRQTKLTSFQRQLNLYGFQRITRGADNTGYYHELFLRGKTFLCKDMQRIKVKGTGFKAASSPDDEPDFYRMPPVIVTPHNSSDDAHSDDGSTMSDTTLTHHPSDRYDSVRRPTLPLITSDPSPGQVISMQVAETLTSTQQSQEQPCAQPLDEVVDELFLQDSSVDENDTILDFVEAWTPMDSFDETEEWWYEPSIDDDAELGRLLEHILERE